MRTLLLFFIFIFGFIGNSFSQDQSKNTPDSLSSRFNGADVVLTHVQYPPQFPGGRKGWSDFLKANINLSIPFANKAITGTYQVVIRFVIEREGTLRNIGAETNCGYGMESEVIRCIKLSPKWTPAQTGNKDVVSYATRQLVIFKINGTDISIKVP